MYTIGPSTTPLSVGRGVVGCSGGMPVSGYFPKDGLLFQLRIRGEKKNSFFFLQISDILFILRVQTTSRYNVFIFFLSFRKCKETLRFKFSEKRVGLF